jgi:signal peptidase
MYPFIKKGDICHFVSTQDANLKKGDIILFHTPNGNLIAHRFCQLVTRNQQLHYLCKGDTNLAHDEAITREQLIGKMTWIERNGRIIHVSNLAAYVWGRTVLGFPLITLVLRHYLNRRESTQE